MGFAKLREQFIRRSVGETEIGTGECFIKNGRAQEAPQLLFLDRIARRGKRVAAARENSSRHLSIERREEGEGSLFQGNEGIATAEFNAIFGNQAIDLRRIDRQRVDRVIQFVR